MSTILENIKNAVSEPDFLNGCIIPIENTDWKIGKYVNEFVVYHKEKINCKYFCDSLQNAAGFIFRKGLKNE